MAIYFDNNATTPVLPEVRDAVLDCLDRDYGNPSSAHALGRKATARIEGARESLSALLGCASPEKIVFTSGGTEANNAVLLSVFGDGSNSHAVVSTVVEHSSILKACRYLERRYGSQVTLLPVDSHGLVGCSPFEEALESSPSLVSVQWANNETGVIQDIERMGAACARAGVLFHVDAAQVLGKLRIVIDSLPVDFMTVSGHKIHGPKGVGALYVKDPTSFAQLLHGGDQEKGLRAGTENVPGIVGFGAAASLRFRNLNSVHAHLRGLRDRFEAALLATGVPVHINGRNAPRVVNTSSVTFIGVEGFALMAQLEKEGVLCSQSSACTNSRPEPSYVLTEMGLSEDEAFSSVRFCFGEQNTVGEVDQAVRVLTQVVARLAA